MQFCPLCRTDPYTNPGSWLLLVPISQKQSETFQQMRKLWKRDIIRISAANFLYFFIQCYWFPLTQIRYMQSRRSYIKKKKCKNFLLGHFQNVLHPPKVPLLYSFITFSEVEFHGSGFATGDSYWTWSQLKLQVPFVLLLLLLLLLL